MTATVPAALAPDAPWVVLKFGGTSVASVERWRTILELACARREEGARVLVVVSALSGVTDALKGLCAGGPERRDQCIAALRERHHALAAAMELASTDGVDRWLASLQAVASPEASLAFAAGGALNGPVPDGVPSPLASGREKDYGWQAEVQAHGELLSSSLGAAFLAAHGLDTVWLDAREALQAHELPFCNARARALSAQVQVAPDPVFAAALAARGEVFITQGFIARNQRGQTVLLGRGGSDTSAAYFGALLGARRVETWTDVAGMFSADPRQVPGARLLERLNFDEAQEIATTGGTVLHPRCLSPCRRAGVPLWIRDTHHPDLRGTIIGPQPRESVPSIKAISSRRGITLVSMETSGMWQQVGFLADVFALFKQHGLSVDLIGSAETNVTVSLDPTENLLDSDVIAALAADLAKVCRVKVLAPCAAVTLVGRGMRSMLHRLSGVLAEFGRERVHLISQSSNNLNLTFVIDENMLDGLLPHLHELLIRAGAMRTDDASLFGPSWQTLYGRESAPARAPWWYGERKHLLALAGAASAPQAKRADDAGSRQLGGCGGPKPLPACAMPPRVSGADVLATPRYAYHLPTIRDRARALLALRAVDRVYYAVKANAHPALLRVLAEAGTGFECVSPGELDVVDALARAHDTPLLFTPNFAPRADYAAGFARGAMVTLDNLYPLEHWPEQFCHREIALRVDPGRGIGHHDKVRTGGTTSKFGVPLDQLDAFLELARKHDVRVGVLHAHLGSGVLDAAHWPLLFGQLASLAERIGTVRALNLGGGLGVPAHPGESELDIQAFDVALDEVKRTYPQFELWLEPGRWLVADAGVLLARVTQVKHKGALAYLGCDAGMHALLRPALYDAWHEIVNLTRLEDPADTLYQVVGPICESGDVLGADRRLPASEEGDVLLIAQVGAYGEAMASSYNLRPLAESVVIE